MPLPDLYAAGVRAGTAALRLKSGHEKTLVITDQGYHSVRTAAAPQKPLAALRITKPVLWRHADERSL